LNLQQAVKFYEKAAALNNPGALTNLGIACLHGEGVAVNHSEGVRLLRIAVKYSFLGAFDWLAYCYINGLGVPQSNLLACCLVQIAVNKGYNQLVPVLDQLKEVLKQVMCEYASVRMFECSNVRSLNRDANCELRRIDNSG
jgi:TPR repeat protein